MSPKFSFAGEKRIANLRGDPTVEMTTAELMEISGKDARTIKLASSWERGKDGKWRYELPNIELEPKFLSLVFIGLRRKPQLRQPSVGRI